MKLLNPLHHDRPYPDAATRELMRTTIAYFETAGHRQLRDDYHHKRWYEGFLAHNRAHGLFATILTPQGEGAEAARWDTWRNSEFGEILGFYGLEYWYTWQVSMLGLGPIWMSANTALKRRASALLQAGGIFAFGLSEKEHGADIYASEMTLTPQPGGGFRARGRKYYIGNGNQAALVAVFGKLADTGEYVFFAVDSQHASYECIQKVTVSQSYVSELALHDYPVGEADIISRGQAAWDAALNTINICKYNLGWASIGMCTHALYEAIHHAAHRRLYKQAVTDFAHVKQLFVDAYVRLLAMKSFATRASDYMRQASAEDRRYLLFNPMVKMKVTTEGERVMNDLWDVIAAKGFEKDMYFQEAAIAIRGLPKLEGTVHVNIALIVKFMPNYFLRPVPYPEVPRRDDARNDSFLFAQGSTKGLGDIRFPDFNLAYQGCTVANVQIFHGQVKAFVALLSSAPPSDAQRRDTGFLLAMGEIFALAVYAQLILENAKIDRVSTPVLDQLFDLLVREMSRLAIDLHGKSATSPEQAAACLTLVQRPHSDAARFAQVWDEVFALRDAYVPQP